MKIAIVGSPAQLRAALDSLLQNYLPEFERVYFEAGEIRRDTLPIDTAAAFVLVEDMSGVAALRSLVERYPALPVTVVSRRPDYALEAIRQGARDYLILPVSHRELERTVWRLGLADERRLPLASAVTG